MKFRHILFLAIGTILLTACNMTLAADVTPPPNYVPPTPIPTLGPRYPASAPDIANGETIYVEKCAPCHGGTGLGDGDQGKQLPVTVIPIGLPETAQKASPAKWYAVVTQGNIDRFMPPFVSLSEQERWDVVAYAFTLHTTEEQVQTGKSLFEEACADCASMFNNQEMMSSLSPNDLVRMMREGAGNVPAFGAGFSDDEAYAVAAYVRTLTFAPPSALMAASATETPVPAPTEAPSAEETPEADEQAGDDSEAETEAGEATEEPAVIEEPEIASAGKVSGLIENRTGKDLPSDLVITLHGFDHGMDPSLGPQEFITLEGNVNPNGNYSFDDIELLERQIYVAELDLDGLSYRSEFAVVSAGAAELTLPTIVVHATTENFNALQIDSMQIFFDLASENTTQIFAVYTITNTGDETVLVKMGDGQNVPFLAFPEGASGLGYEATQDSAPFVPTGDGFAMPPSQNPYGLIAFASLPKAGETSITQPALLDINEVYLFLPEGVNATGTTLTDNGIQAIQNTNFHIYTATAFKQGESLEFTISGKPSQIAVNPNPMQNRTLLVGVGALGIALVLAGVWMYMRDRKEGDEEFEGDTEDDEDDDAFDDAEAIMDAIIALDDLHRAGKISDEAYKQRRNELKASLKRKG
jgi:mono/diheme cytochrome c family protein